LFDLLKITNGAAGMADDMNSGVGQKVPYREAFRKYNLELPRYLK
jgi:hypothetical protein